MQTSMRPLILLRRSNLPVSNMDLDDRRARVSRNARSALPASPPPLPPCAQTTAGKKEGRRSAAHLLISSTVCTAQLNLKQFMNGCMNSRSICIHNPRLLSPPSSFPLLRFKLITLMSSKWQLCSGWWSRISNEPEPKEISAAVVGSAPRPQHPETDNTARGAHAIPTRGSEPRKRWGRRGKSD